MSASTNRRNLPHNKNGILSAVLFAVTFGAWLAALWIYSDKTTGLPDKDMDFIFWVDLVTFFPFLGGAILGGKGLFQRDTSPMFSFLGFALNGIMAFRFIYSVMGLSW